MGEHLSTSIAHGRLVPAAPPSPPSSSPSHAPSEAGLPGWPCVRGPPARAAPYSPSSSRSRPLWWHASAYVKSTSTVRAKRTSKSPPSLSRHGPRPLALLPPARGPKARARSRAEGERKKSAPGGRRGRFRRAPEAAARAPTGPCSCGRRGWRWSRPPARAARPVAGGGWPGGDEAGGARGARRSGLGALVFPTAGAETKSLRLFQRTSWAAGERQAAAACPRARLCEGGGDVRLGHVQQGADEQPAPVGHALRRARAKRPSAEPRRGIYAAEHTQ